VACYDQKKAMHRLCLQVEKFGLWHLQQQVADLYICCVSETASLVLHGRNPTKLDVTPLRLQVEKLGLWHLKQQVADVFAANYGSACGTAVATPINFSWSSNPLFIVNLVYSFQIGCVCSACMQVEKFGLWHLKQQVADPQLRARLTPSYSVGCKRM
jgi:starvation-inducible outer membrane lipoprotein